MIWKALAKTVAIVSAAFLLFAGPAAAQSGGGQINVEIRDGASDEIRALHPEMVRRAAAMGLPVTRLDSRASAARFEYPLRPSATAIGFAEDAISAHVDLDATTGLQDFVCGTRTYDGHRGTDIYLTPFSWNVMDRFELRVVAAQPGVILNKADGNFDRQCSINNSPANFVIIRHDNGLVAYYWHLKRGSVTTKPVGARVALGEPLGFVGSSGNSTGPHLHFEVQDAVGNVIDPYVGQCNTVGSRWSHQARAIDPAVVRVATHYAAPPSITDNCVNPNPRYANRFNRGQQVFAAAHLRDQTPTTRANIAILRPDRSVATSYLSGAPASGFWSSAYWYTGYTIPANAPVGEWRVRVTFLGRFYEHVFWVAAPSAAQSPTTIAATVAWKVRTLTPGTPANFQVTLRNTGIRRAIGCRLSLGRPINADVFFRQANASGVPIGPANVAFAIPANGTQRAVLTITPRTGFIALLAEFAVIAKCTNSGVAPFSRVANMLTLTRG